MAYLPFFEYFSFTNFLEAASYYADRGLAVFPLLPQSKVPATPNGFKDATTNADQIQAWWSDESPPSVLDN
jgi:hypothetical protein